MHQSQGTWLLEDTLYIESCKWHTGLSPLSMLFPKAYCCTSISSVSQPHNSIHIVWFPNWAFPDAFTITEGIPVGSHPPPTYMLKFSGLADLSSCFVKQTSKSFAHASCHAATQPQRSHTQAQRPACSKQGTCTVCVMATTRSDTQRRTTAYVQMQQSYFACAHEYTDTETGKPPGIAWRYNVHSNLYWFTEFCYSSCLSHFAAPFIIIPAKASNAENCVVYAQ